MIRLSLPAALTALVVLMACGSEGTTTSVFDFGVQQVGKIGRAAPKGPTAAEIRARLTPDVMASVAGGVIVASIPERNAASALFETGRNGDVVTYFTPDGISLALRQGMLVGTRGLGFDLMTADVDEPLAAVAGGGETGAVRIHRYLDGENQVQLRSLVCHYARTGAEVSETCRTPGATISNRYVLAGDGRIVASRQWIGPELGYVDIQQVRP